MKRQLRRQQRRWARSAGLEPDSGGYLESIESNLFEPLSASALADFADRGSAEFLPHESRPARMRALHSSAALVVNVFDYWARRDPAPLAHALALDAPIDSLSFEARFPTGLVRSTPTLDVALELGGGALVGIESKFGEWLVPQRRSREPFKEKYLDSGRELWRGQGLPRCQEFVEAIMQREETFRILDAPQLLKQALGLAIARPGQFALRYVYHDLACAASAVHREELRRFAERVGGEIAFKALTYQALYRYLRERGDVDRGYIAYLGTRYGW